MATEELILRFGGVSVADANRYAEDLRRELLDVDDSLRVERHRDDATAQDFGAALVLILGTPAVVVAARAIERWLARNNAVSLDVELPDGTIRARNLESKDVADVVAALSRRA